MFRVKMSSCSYLGVLSILFSAIISSFASTIEPTSVEASVPIVNRCNDSPRLFHQNWHYRNTFEVIIKKDTQAKFELLNPKSIGDEEFFITCLHNTKESELRLIFSQNTPFSYEVYLNSPCVPTVSVLKLCNSAPVNPIVRLTSMENQTFQPLPVIEFESFETYNPDAENFLNQIVNYGFVKTPRAQLLIGKVDVDGLLKNNTFIDGLKVINDVIEKYVEYSGRSFVPITTGPRINIDLEKNVLLFKSQQCKVSCTRHSLYTFDRIVVWGNNILRFFTPDAKLFSLLHEIGHHFDLRSKDFYIDVNEAWANIYAFFYQSRFEYKNEADYQMQKDLIKDDGLARKLYENRISLQHFPIHQKSHFLTALFALDGYESSVFRSYNLKTMNDPDITKNILKSIAVFIKDQYDINVAPFIERVIYKGIPWLNITNIYDLVESKNFRMPCFLFPNKSDSARYRFEEHNFKVATNLRLCPTTSDKFRKIGIIVNNKALRNHTIKVNSVTKTVSKDIVEIESNEEMFVFWGAVNKTAVILPTYIFCSVLDIYSCTVTPNLLTYNDQNPSQLLPPFRFEIFDTYRRLFVVIQVDTKNMKMLIKTVEENDVLNLPKDRSDLPYVEMRLYNEMSLEVTRYKIDGTNTPFEETWFDIKFNYTFELKAQQPNRVRILNYSLNDLASNVFKIDEFGVTELPWRHKIRSWFVQMLSNDLEYKPYLNKYQHLTDLLRIMKKG